MLARKADVESVLQRTFRVDARLELDVRGRRKLRVGFRDVESAARFLQAAELSVTREIKWTP